MNHNPVTLSVCLVVCETDRIPAKQPAIPVVGAYLLGCEMDSNSTLDISAATSPDEPQ